MKICTTCEAEKPLSGFYKSSSGKHGVMAECKECKNLRSSNDYLGSRESVLTRTRKYIEKNRDAYREWSADWYAKNIDKAKTRSAIYYKNATPERRARLRQLSGEYWKTHPSELAEKNARIRMTRRKACVKWRNKFFVREVYSLARLRTKLLGVIHHVDHIVPIKHPLVCGLHNEFNLTVLTQFENLSKGNRHWPDMPEELGIV